MRKLTPGTVFEDGAEIIDCYRAADGTWRALVHWPHDIDTDTNRYHPWCVCHVDWDGTKWVRYSSTWAHTRPDAESVYLKGP